MEGVWSVQQITLHWTSRAFANVTSYICLHLFHSEVHDWISSKLLTNFELKILIIFFPFSVLPYLLCVIFLVFVIFMLFGVMLEVLFQMYWMLHYQMKRILFFLADGRPIADILQPSKRFAGNSSYPGILFVGKSQRF